MNNPHAEALRTIARRVERDMLAKDYDNRKLVKTIDYKDGIIESLTMKVVDLQNELSYEISNRNILEEKLSKFKEYM